MPRSRHIVMSAGNQAKAAGLSARCGEGSHVALSQGSQEGWQTNGTNWRSPARMATGQPGSTSATAYLPMFRAVVRCDGTPPTGGFLRETIGAEGRQYGLGLVIDDFGGE